VIAAKRSRAAHQNDFRPRSKLPEKATVVGIGARRQQHSFDPIH
jgi:hypothetical protein